MSMEENKALVRRIYDELNRRNLATIDENTASDYVGHALVHNPLRPAGVASGVAGVKQDFTMHYTAFPDWQITIDDMIAEGDNVVIVTTERGRHQGEWLGIAPTGQQVTVQGVTIFRIADGKIAEAWGLADRAGMWQQLGLIPETSEILPGLKQ